MVLDTWSLIETGFHEEQLARSESLFSIGNGYLGFRGFPCEREPAHHAGVFINGFYELSPIHYGEDAYGFARWNQTMLDLPDARYLSLIVEGQRVRVSDESVTDYQKKLDFRTGILVERMKLKTESGHTVTISWESLVSMTSRHIGAVRLTVTSEADVSLTIRSSIAMPQERAMSGLDPRVGTMLTKPSLNCIDSRYFTGIDDERPGFQASFKTVESALHLACGAVHTSSAPLQAKQCSHESGGLPTLEYTYTGKNLTFTKYFYYHTSGRAGEELPLEQVQEHRSKAAHSTWEELAEQQKRYYNQFWHHADVGVTGDDKLQQALRFNLFQLNQSTGRDGMSSLAAKGLTGSGYEGHYFWDTEIYGMPFFNHTQSSVARSLITYRISTIDYARSRARELHQRGALFPWRTINGLEASAYFPAGTAQYHINADIAYTILQYLEVTGDDSILDEGAAELLIETARLYLDLGFFNPEKGGRFCLNEVTGPDEYSALVDNNCYTNVMVQHHFEGVVSLAGYLREHRKQVWDRLESTLFVTDEEIDLFSRAAELMYIPFDRKRGIHPQDDYFLNKEPWDTAKRGEIRHPMLLNYHPLVIYRHQVLKQADTVLALLLQHQRFPWYQRKRDFDFYEPLTTGDSSLSACIQGIVAYDCGYLDLGNEYLRQTALMDIDDLHRNTKDGLHTAAMAGSWMAMVYGLAGYRMMHAVPTFRPQLPPSLERLQFSLTFKKTILTVCIEQDMTTYCTDGGLLTIQHRSEKFIVGEKPVQLSTKPHCKAVIFDLDGVVTSTDGHHYRAWKRLADENGWEFDEEVNQGLRGISRTASLQVILDHNNAAVPPEKIEVLTSQKNEWYRASLEDLTPENILPGIPELLVALKQRGIHTAIASASRNAPFILQRLALADSFDVVAPAGEVVCGKPDPEVFARAADLLGLFPEECTGIEDAPAGITAIQAARMHTVGVGSAVHPDTCAHHVSDTTQLTVDMVLF